MLKSGIRLIAPCAVKVSESPVWEESRRQLHFVDIYGARIGSIDWASGALSWLGTSEPIGCVGLAGHEYFAAGLANGMALIERSSGRCTPLGDFAIEPGNRLNDGRCAPGGRHFWVGSMVETLDRPGGHLYRMDALGNTWTMASDITCSNGLAWSPDGRTMFHADSRQSTVWAYDYDIGSGAIANKRTFCVAQAGEGRPDGAAVDIEGCYWSARYDGWRIVRHAPDGSELFVLKTPVQNPTMCAFAGDDLSTLVFTSARGSLSKEALREQPDAGGVFAVDVAVAGLPEPAFKRRG
ncbi:MAG: SMP-30/gluconolactonase/LRE family protein [Enhydrobacter sp.]|nr:SMP-30/gluconolactonase/LRE family protein [Enhydrobacter sp.]